MAEAGRAAKAAMYGLSVDSAVLELRSQQCCGIVFFFFSPHYVLSYLFNLQVYDFLKGSPR